MSTPLVRVPLTLSEIRRRVVSAPVPGHFANLTIADASWLAPRFCAAAGETGNWKHLAAHLKRFEMVIQIRNEIDRRMAGRRAGG